MEKVIISFSFQSESRRGCTLVLNLKSFFSFVNTTAAGIAALIGETILHIPENIEGNLFTCKKHINAENTQFCEQGKGRTLFSPITRPGLWWLETKLTVLFSGNHGRVVVLSVDIKFLVFTIVTLRISLKFKFVAYTIYCKTEHIFVTRTCYLNLWFLKHSFVIFFSTLNKVQYKIYIIHPT